MFLATLLWFVKAFTLTFIIDPIVTVFSPIICLFVVKREESEVTGFPSMLPGKPREFLVSWLRWCQTTDAPLDEYWYGDYPSWFKTKFGTDYYESHWWLRYVCRILWVVRNPAYGFGTVFGYDAAGLTVTSERDEEDKWRTGVNCNSYWIFKNDKGQVGFCVRAQYYYWGQHCLEMYLGYKLPGDTVRGKKLVAIQFTPFRQYAKI